MQNIFEDAEKAGELVTIAKSWLGTPYQHLAHQKWGGVDCANLIGQIFLEAGYLDSVDVPYYAPDWYLHEHSELMIDGVTQNFQDHGVDGATAFLYVEKHPPGEHIVGDILLMRLDSGTDALHHAGLYIGDGKFLHALEATGVTIDLYLNDWVAKCKQYFRIVRRD